MQIPTVVVILPPKSARRSVSFTINPPGAFCCSGCRDKDAMTLIQQDEAGDDAGSDLCRPCSLAETEVVPFSQKWPVSVTAADIVEVWDSAFCAQAQYLRARMSLEGALRASLVTYGIPREQQAGDQGTRPVARIM